MKEFQEQLLKRLDRLTDTFDRLATVLGYESDAAAVRANPRGIQYKAELAKLATDASPGFTFAESGEEYQQRQSRDAAFAISLGVAPWSRDFQTTIMQMKSDLTRRHMENRQDAEGNYEAYEAEGRSEEEAEQIVRDAFKLARAEANVRKGAAV